ncbi:MAG: hypothetical protein ACRBDI_08710 [Alphaproteobacteria bacterium]
MGLDVYVGALSRYYKQDWETISQTIAKEQEIDFVVLGAEPVTDEVGELRKKIDEWRDGVKDYVKDASGGKEAVAFKWDESDDASFFTDKPDWDGYGALLLWAAYSEHDDLSVTKILDDDWINDEAFLRSTADDFRSNYTALLNADMWVPEEFAFVLSVHDVFGHDTAIGSIVKLGQELLALNDKTWQADSEEITRWLRDGFSDVGDLEHNAKFGFALFLDLANKAVDHNLIMKIDC